MHTVSIQAWKNIRDSQPSPSPDFSMELSPFCLDQCFFSKCYQINMKISSLRINSCQTFYLLANSDIVIHKGLLFKKDFYKDSPL